MKNFKYFIKVQISFLKENGLLLSMNRTFCLKDRNVIGFLLLLYEDDEISSSEMTEFNGNYDHIKDAAIRLREAGLVISENSPQRRNKVVWKLTPEGKVIAEHLMQAEMMLRRHIAH